MVPRGTPKRHLFTPKMSFSRFSNFDLCRGSLGSQLFENTKASKAAWLCHLSNTWTRVKIRRSHSKKKKGSPSKRNTKKAEKTLVPPSSQTIAMKEFGFMARGSCRGLFVKFLAPTFLETEGWTLAKKIANFSPHYSQNSGELFRFCGFLAKQKHQGNRNAKGETAALRKRRRGWGLRLSSTDPTCKQEHFSWTPEASSG